MQSDRATPVSNMTGNQFKGTAATIAGDVKSQFDAKANQMNDAATSVYGEVKDAVQSGLDQMASMTADISQSAAKTARSAGAEASHLGRRAYAQAEEAGKYAGVQVQEKPLVMLLLAGALGCLIGHFLSSRR
jgi:ElaB/YqjD/DUF883 family membrane-anchored ribosome-binding protein